MAVTDAYATPALYRLVVSKSDAAEDTEILADLTAVSRLIEHRTGRFFGRDAAPVARVYAVPPDANRVWIDPFFVTPWNRPTDARPLEIDDVATATGFEVRTDAAAPGTFPVAAWGATDYQLEPLNAALGPEPAPYTRVLVPSWSSQSGFPAGGRVQVTAVWGWPAVPVAIVRATAHLTGILRLESPRATNRVDEMGQVLSTSRAAQTILDDLVRAYGRRALMFA